MRHKRETKMNATQRMIEKVQAAIDRNQNAMRLAVEKGRMDVADLCGDYHKRLRTVMCYLEERDAR